MKLDSRRITKLLTQLYCSDKTMCSIGKTLNFKFLLKLTVSTYFTYLFS